MNDDKPAAPAEAPPADDDLLARIERAIDRITSGGAPMRIPRDLTDADIVLADCRKYIESLQADNTKLRDACSRMNDEISQILGRALGYPRFCDDQKNFPGATDADGVCVGDHVAESLAAETAARVESMQAENRQLRRLRRADMVIEEFGDSALAARDARIRELEALLNTPELHDFSAAVVREAAHQRERWGTEHDTGKQPQDWFWLVGYLAGKCLAAHIAGNTDKALHHTISTAAALANWHAAIEGKTDMQPGHAPSAELGDRLASPDSAPPLQEPQK